MGSHFNINSIMFVLAALWRTELRWTRLQEGKPASIQAKDFSSMKYSNESGDEFQCCRQFLLEPLHFDVAGFELFSPTETEHREAP